MKYKLLAIDIDGTLIGADQQVSADARAAIAAAQEAGLRICLATGRSLAESMPVWRQLPLVPPYEPLVLIGGAMVSEPDTGRTLYHRTIAHEVAAEFGAALSQAGYSSLAFVDGWRHDVDYFFAPAADAAAAQKLWFSKMQVRIRQVPSLGNPALPPCLRINAVTDAVASAGLLAEQLKERFAGRLNIQSILAPNYGVMIVEAHSPAADKFKAITYVAQAHKLPPSAIAAIGDDVNDVPMLAGAGLGVAFPHSPDSVRDAARHIAADGLASFIRQLVDGKFD